MIQNKKYNLILCLFTLFAVTSCANLSSDKYTAEDLAFIVGTYTKGTSQGIYQISLDTSNQTLTNNGLLAMDINPSYLANDNKGTIFAAIGDVSGGISVMNKSPQNDIYEHVFKVTGLGKGACHIALNPDNTKVAIATYGSGEIFQFDINVDTNQLFNKKHYKHTGSSLTKRQTSPHMHFVQWDKSGRFLYSVDLGTDEILVFDNKTDNFTPNVAAKLDAGDGPRHFSFHPKQPLLYVLNELSNSITSFKINPKSGGLIQQDKLSLLNNNKPDVNYSSAIKISNDGKFLYAAIRGVNKIAVLDIQTPKLNYLQKINTQGNWPRDIEISKDQKYLLIANQYSNSITVLKRNIDDGSLVATDIKISIDTPSFIGAL